MHDVLCYTYTIVRPPVVNIDLQNKTTEVKEGDSVNFFCSATGLGASTFTYQWFLNREPVDGQSTSLLVIDEVSVYTTGDYTCSVKSQYGGIGRSGKATLILSGNYTAKYLCSVLK